MDTRTITQFMAFAVIDCFRCGALFAIPLARKDQLVKDGSVFYCPNGHGQHFCNSPEERLREAIEKNANLARKLELAETTLRNEKREHENTKATHLRLVKTGTCPCCRRNFSNLHRHMKHKHPEYGK